MFNRNVIENNLTPPFLTILVLPDFKSRQPWPSDYGIKWIPYWEHFRVHWLPPASLGRKHFFIRARHFGFSTKDTGLTTTSEIATSYVSSLYTNIPHMEGIQACWEALDWREILPPLIWSVWPNSHYKNNFIFSGAHYLQTQGSTMGTAWPIICYGQTRKGTSDNTFPTTSDMVEAR